MLIAHVAFDFRFRHEGRYGVDNYDVNRAGAHQNFADLKRLLAGVRLRDQQILNVHAKLLGVFRIKRVFGVDEGRNATSLLRVRDDVQTERRLALESVPMRMMLPLPQLFSICATASARALRLSSATCVEAMFPPSLK